MLNFHQILVCADMLQIVQRPGERRCIQPNQFRHASKLFWW